MPEATHDPTTARAEPTAAQTVASLLRGIAVLENVLAEYRAKLASHGAQPRRDLAAQPVVGLAQWRRAAQ